MNFSKQQHAACLFLVVSMSFCIMATAVDTDTSVFYPVDKKSREDISREKNNAGKLSKDSIGTTIVLQNERAVFHVNIATGNLRRICAKTGEILLGDICLSYELQEENGGTVTADGAMDRVTGQRKNGTSCIEFECINPAMKDLTFRKSYRLLPEGQLSMKVVVGTKRQDRPMLLISSQMNPLDLIRSNSIRYGFSTPPGYFPDDQPSIFYLDAWGPATHQVMPVFVNRQAGMSVGFHTFKIQDRFVYARDNDCWRKAENGMMKSETLAASFLLRDRPFSCEFRILAQFGDALDYYRAYQSQKEYLALFNNQSPVSVWFDRVRYVTDCGVRDLLNNWKTGDPLPPIPKNQSDILIGNDPDDCALFVLFGWGELGAGPVAGKWLAYGPDALPMDVQGVRRVFDVVRSWDTRFKVALYDWNRSFDPAIEPFLSNPDWAARDRYGKTQLSFFYGLAPWWPKDAQPNFLNPHYQNYYLGQIGKYSSIYGVDAYYIDAEVGRTPDWPSRNYPQPGDRDDFLRAYRSASGTALPLVRNAPNDPMVNGAYWEGRGLHAEKMEDRWQALGTKVLQEKIWQWKYRWTALMRWDSHEKKEPYYSNYLVGLGFKPHAPADPLRKFPYLQAAFEMRHLELCGAKFSPCFWRGDPTDTEAYLLRQGQALYISAIGHSEAVKRETFSIDAKDSGLDFSKPLFAWCLDMQEGGKFPPVLNVEYEQMLKDGQFPQRRPDIQCKWLPRRIINLSQAEVTIAKNGCLSITANIRPKCLTMIVISPFPALVVSESGQISQMPVPGTADVKLSGDYDSMANEWKLNISSRHGCKLAFPDAVKRVLRGGVELKLSHENVSGQTMNVVSMPGGELSVLLQPHSVGKARQ